MSISKPKEKFSYLELLDDNAPRPYEEYDSEALILKKQIDAPTVQNIAVVAKYGAGKSSVINTYLYNYRRTEKEKKDKKNLGRPENNRYARVTLSTFNNAEYDETAIERSILQQLLYSRKKSELPNSEIKRTNKVSWKKSLGIALLPVLLLISVVLFGLQLSSTPVFTAEWVKFLFLGTAILSAALIAFGAVHFKKLSKIKYKDFEAIIKSDDDKDKPHATINLINKFVDEVLYFFECVDIDLVIFEDLDRLPTTTVFAKLRELNTIINSSRKGRGKVTFLYAVKDELFKTEEERVKFFEFILPVVPVVNTVTTEETIREKLKALTDINKEMKLSDKFIKGISPYILDMRLLKNTFNDYIIMFSKIFEDEKAGKDLKPEMLYALCLYKNLFPYDYALLESNEGMIPSVVDIKALREKALADLESKIAQTKKHIDDLNSEEELSFEELRYAFVGLVLSMNFDRSYRSSATTDPRTIDTFKDLDIKTIVHPLHNTAVLPPEGWDGSVIAKYYVREKLIKERAANGVVKAKEKLVRLEGERRTILSLNFFGIVDKYKVDFCFSKNLIEDYLRQINATIQADDKLFLESMSSTLVGKIDKATAEEIERKYKEFKKTEFRRKIVEKQIEYLRFLVANGYINEHYLEYTSNYKAQLVTPRDIAFVMAIQRRNQDFECALDDVFGVVGRLEEDDFKHPAILNRTLLDNLDGIKRISESENSKKFSNLVKTLGSTEEESVLDATRKYLLTASEDRIESLLKVVIPTRATLFYELARDDKILDKMKIVVFVCTVKYSIDYKVANIKKEFARFIEKSDSYLEIFERVGNDTLVIKFIDEVDLRMEFLRYGKLDNPIQKHILDNNRYALTLENLESIFPTASNEDDFYFRNYDFVLSSDKQTVIKYIEVEIGEYIRNILLNKKIALSKEPPDRLRSLFMNKNVSFDLKIELAGKTDFRFECLKAFDEDMIELFVSCDIIEPSWENVLYAFEKKGFDCIKNFLLKHKAIKGKFIEDKGTEIHRNFLKAMVDNLNATEASLILATLSVSCGVELLVSEEANEEVIAEFILAGKIKYEKDALTKIYELPETLSAYLIKHEKSIIDEFDTFFDCVLPVENRRNQQVYRNNRYENQTLTTYSTKQNALDIIDAILASGAGLAIKKNIITKCFQIIDISDSEEVYADFFLANSLPVPAKILWQFKKDGPIRDEDRRRLLELSIGSIDTIAELTNYKAYFSSLGDGWGVVYEAARELRVKREDGIERLLLALKGKKLLKVRKSKAKDKDELIVEAAA